MADRLLFIVVQRLYASPNGYTDELAWAAAHLYRATGETVYRTQAISYFNKVGAGGVGAAALSFANALLDCVKSDCCILWCFLEQKFVQSAALSALDGCLLRQPLYME